LADRRTTIIAKALIAVCALLLVALASPLAPLSAPGSPGAAHIAAGDEATPSPTPAPYQPEPPIQAAFFYPWYPKAWRQLEIFPYANYHPLLGYYSSVDNAVVDQQLELARLAHLDAFIASWWGPGAHTDVSLKSIIARAENAASPNPDLRWAVIYELEGQGDPTPDEIVAHLQYLDATYFGHNSYLRVNGEPVVFVYIGIAENGPAMAQRWAQAAAAFGPVYTVLNVFPGFRTDPNQPDSWHQYAPSQHYDERLPFYTAVSPGFWKVGEAAPRLERDPVRFRTDVQTMLASGAAWQLIISWNEEGEGTPVEPTTAFGTEYLQILCETLPGPSPCPDPWPALVPTDFDGDGFTDANESLKIGTLPDKACGGDGWPANLNDAGASFNKLDLLDLSSFISPVRRLTTSPGDTNFSARWDLIPGGVGKFINLQDLAAVISGNMTATARPPMFGASPAYNRTCPLPP